MKRLYSILAIILGLGLTALLPAEPSEQEPKEQPTEKRRLSEHEARIREILERRRQQMRAAGESTQPSTPELTEHQMRVRELIRKRREANQAAQDSLDSAEDSLQARLLKMSIDEKVELLKENHPSYDEVWLAEVLAFDEKSPEITLNFNDAQVHMVSMILNTQIPGSVHLNWPSKRMSVFAEKQPLEKALTSIALDAKLLKNEYYSWRRSGNNWFFDKQANIRTEFHNALGHGRLALDKDGTEGGVLTIGTEMIPFKKGGRVAVPWGNETVIYNVTRIETASKWAEFTATNGEVVRISEAPPEEKITVVFNDAKIETVIEIISAQSRFKLKPTTSVTGLRVSLIVQNEGLNEILSQFSSQHSLRWWWEDEETIRLGLPEENPIWKN